VPSTSDPNRHQRIVEARLRRRRPGEQDDAEERESDHSDRDVYQPAALDEAAEGEQIECRLGTRPTTR